MDAIYTRRWPRHHVHLPVFIAANTEGGNVRVPGLACELSRGGMELYGGLNLQLGEALDVEFQIAGKIRVGGVIRNRSGFCFGVEFRALLTEPELTEPGSTESELTESGLTESGLTESGQTEPEATPDRLETIFWQRHEAYMQQLQVEFEQSLQTMMEMRKCRMAIERIADALNADASKKEL
jgi:hypothetical protein